MVKIDEALNIVYKQEMKKRVEIVPIDNAMGRVCAKAYHATLNLPRFDNSAMDGYALSSLKNCTIQKNAIYAGDDKAYSLAQNEAIKIMTGAKIPLNCIAVIPQEKVSIEGETLIFEPIKEGSNIRKIGEDIIADKLLVSKNKKINAYDIALLSSQGISHIEVYQRPKVTILSSGAELKAFYEKIEPHQIYNSNAPMLYARTKELGADVVLLNVVEDDLERLVEVLDLAKESDLIITTGGASVGDKDFTLKALSNLGMEFLFHKIDIKPGKPTSLGKLKNTFVAILAGNPLASMVNFELFIRPLILKLSGDKCFYHQLIETSIAQSEYKIKRARDGVILGYYDGKSFSPTLKQDPFMVSALSPSNAMLVVKNSLESLPQNIKIIHLALQSEKVEDILN